ncbi:MAG: TMEM175 family protein, partial [Bryobacteraceae bacterium]
HALVARQFPSYVMFVVTFAMLGIKWLNHHRLFTLIRRVDTTLNLLNLLLLLGICAVPFTTALLAKYLTTPDAAFASAIYGVVWIVNGFLYTAILVYARDKHYVEKSADTRRLLPLYFTGPLGYIVAVGVSFLNIYAGIALYLVIVSLYIAPQRVMRSATRAFSSF